MSVIVSRALPDARDGFKPVHRRVLYAMHQMGMRSTSRYRKSAGIVGEVIKNWHPHSDTAAYDTLVRMAQDFSLRYPLVDGQGNFGSVDGDKAAAMRYTEAKMAAIADELLADIDKETVDEYPNYDASMMQPTVLPGRLPNLLVNGSAGIAVGMATNIPPHNLNEICDGIALLLDDPDTTIEQLMEVDSRTGLSDRWHDRGARRHPGGLRHRAWSCAATRQGVSSKSRTAEIAGRSSSPNCRTR
jgi:DNA gyrase subunit A